LDDIVTALLKEGNLGRRLGYFEGVFTDRSSQLADGKVSTGESENLSWEVEETRGRTRG
jgi:hypothetical protein